jgi:hypothetical protein
LALVKTDNLGCYVNLLSEKTVDRALRLQSMDLDWSYSVGEVSYEVGVLTGEGVPGKHLKGAESRIVLTYNLPENVKVVNVRLLGFFE